MKMLIEQTASLLIGEIFDMEMRSSDETPASRRPRSSSADFEAIASERSEIRRRTQACVDVTTSNTDSDPHNPM